MLGDALRWSIGPKSGGHFWEPSDAYSQRIVWCGKPTPPFADAALRFRRWTGGDRKVRASAILHDSEGATYLKIVSATEALFHYVKVVVLRRSETAFSADLENAHGDVTSLVCFHALQEANRDLEKARLRYRIAAHALRTIRERLNEALEQAYRQQSLGPLGDLFDEEETRLAVYKKASANVADAEERWCMLRAALAYEKDLMRAGPLSPKRLN